MLTYARRHISLKYLIITGVMLAAVFSALYFWISGRQEQYIMAQVEKQAVILHRQIVLTRQWVSDHNYVLVANKDNTFTDYILDSPKLHDVHGKAYTRITPAGLTRSLSEYAGRSRLYSFNLANHDGINPLNQPDEFESRAIALFKSGEQNGLGRLERTNGNYVYRYAAPLLIRESCLGCHTTTIYQVGDVGGCISVLIPCREAVDAIKSEKLSLFSAMAGLTITVMMILFFLTQRLISRPIRKIRDITSRIRSQDFDHVPEIKGDELSQLTGLCYLIDDKLKNQHLELEKKITQATGQYHATNRKLLELNGELTKLNQAKTDFFSDISHELRTPLTAIKGATDTLIRKSSCADPVYVNIIRKNTEHLHQTIIDFLDYARIENGRLELDRQRVQLSGMAKDVILSHEAVAAEKAIRIELKCRDELYLNADPHRLFQVLSNLVSNAVKFSPHHSKVQVDIARSGNHITTAIADEGPGIDPRHHDAIFQKFYQIPGRPNDHVHKGSSGIGLSICKALVLAHGGRISVESRPGKGSVFKFALPMEPQHQDLLN
ncbi:MAG: DUF3365 domain-containing protein [Desulfobacteraceae bacterium]|nr:DUF3365 domain-containing protein [Desulfobacteraceae bacterium]